MDRLLATRGGMGGRRMAALLLAAYAVYNLLSASGLAAPAPILLHALALLLLVAGSMAVVRSRPSPAVQVDPSPVGYMAALRMLASAIDAGDSFARGRSYRISRFCVRIAEHLGFSAEEVDDLECAALLHDIGRTAIHLDVLSRPRELGPDERAIIRTHPGMSYEILRDIPFLSRAAEIAYAHHEQPDGKGYPRGLVGGAIPKGSRIIMVVAAFDAMTSDSPYRRALSTKEACEELRSYAGTQFFPQVVAALIELVSRGQLFDGLDFGELAMYTSGQGTSMAVEEFLQSDAAKAKGISVVDASGKPSGARPDYEIDLPPESPGSRRDTA